MPGASPLQGQTCKINYLHGSTQAHWDREITLSDMCTARQKLQYRLVSLSLSSSQCSALPSPVIQRTVRLQSPEAQGAQLMNLVTCLNILRGLRAASLILQQATGSKPAA